MLGQGQTEVHELIKGVALSMTLRALQRALQLASKDVLDDAVAAAVSVLPSFISLLTDAAFPLELLVGRLPLHSVQLRLYNQTHR